LKLGIPGALMIGFEWLGSEILALEAGYLGVAE
jgi:hypothetical protein